MNFQRRRAPRYHLIAEAQIVESHSHTNFKARTSDVSALGCFLNSPYSLPSGARIELQITYHERTFTAGGTVIRSEPAMGIGVSFEDVKPDQRELLAVWLNEAARLPSA